MSRRRSAQVLFTISTVLITVVVAVLMVVLVRTSISDGLPNQLEDATAAAWTVLPLLLVCAAFAAWFLSGYLLKPLDAMRRDLTLNARMRALSEFNYREVEEVAALRETLVWVLRDLEADVRASEREKRQVFGFLENVNEGIMQVGGNGRFVHVNRAARKMLSLPGQPEGQSIAALVRNQEVRDLLERAAIGADAVAGEITLDQRHLLLKSQPLLGEQGGAVITLVDLTELKRLESVRRDFVANVSHELKTPLTSIRGYTETLISDELSRQEQLQFLQIIDKNAMRLQRIVEDLLDLSRLQSGGWKPDLEEVDLNLLACDAWTACEPAAQRKDIGFEIAGAPVVVLADPSGLRQVFANVFENAVRYTPEGGHVKIDIHTAGHHVDVAISDNGIGIPGAELSRIFERFYRVNPGRSRADGGTGLGLAIVKHLLEQMGGSVTAKSTLGEGTTITIRLPRYSSDA